MIKKLLATVAVALMMIPGGSGAAVNDTVPETHTCSIGSYDEEKLKKFSVTSASRGGIIVQNVLIGDNSRLIIVDYGMVANAPEKFYIVRFDPFGCYLDEAWISEEDIRDIYGIVIASK